MRYIAEDATLRFKFTTRDDTGLPATLSGTPSLSVYVEDSATQITSGITLTADYDSKTGLNDVVIDLSASASYAAGKKYEVVIEAGTVDSVSVVGEVVYEFYIHASGGLEALITRGILALPAAAADAAGGLPISDAGGLDLDAMAASVSATEGYVDTEVAAILAAVDTEVAAILADTNEIQGDWTNGGRLDLILDSILADTNELQGDIADGGRIDLLIDAILADTNELQSDDYPSRFDTLDSSLATIAGYLDTEVAAILAAVDTEVASILADTNELQGDWANGGRLDMLLDATVALMTTQLTESYRSTGAAPTPAQALMEILQHLGESSIASTTKTLKKLDQSTTAKTFTLNDASTPTAITEAT